MKHWLVLLPLVVLLAALALTVRAWLPPVLTFVGANTDLFQGLQAALQIVLWLGTAAMALFAFLRARQPAPGTAARTAVDIHEHESTVKQKMDGTGVQVAHDQTIQGDLVLGDTIGRQVNTGGGAYVEGDVHSRGGDFVGRDRGVSPRDE